MTHKDEVTARWEKIDAFFWSKEHMRKIARGVHTPTVGLAPELLINKELQIHAR